MIKPYLYLAVAILSEVLATTALKASEGMTKLLPTLALVAGYGLAFWCLSIAVKSIPVGLAYALWSGFGIVMIASIGWYFYGQTLNMMACLGIVLILIGSVCVVLSDGAVMGPQD
jgi:small multidrug resistance pump